MWLDMPGETTVSRTGKRTITICTTGQNKDRFTVILAAMADGRKLKTYVVFMGIRPVAACTDGDSRSGGGFQQEWVDE